MEWFSQNWVWVLLAVAMIAMHLFGHGGHGGNNDRHNDAGAPKRDSGTAPSQPRSGHRH